MDCGQWTQACKANWMKQILAQLLMLDHIEPHNATCLNAIGSKKGIDWKETNSVGTHIQNCLVPFKLQGT